MTEKTIRLTKKQQQWRDHIRAAESQGLTLSAYARQHQLPLPTLYSAKHVLLKKGALGKSSAPFVKVAAPASVMSLESRIHIILPNRVRLELPAGHPGLEQLLRWVSRL